MVIRAYSKDQGWNLQTVVIYSFGNYPEKKFINDNFPWLKVSSRKFREIVKSEVAKRYLEQAIPRRNLISDFMKFLIASWKAIRDTLQIFQHFRKLSYIVQSKPEKLRSILYTFVNVAL